MRSDQEIVALLLETANSDERIRAVILNGSRANPNAPRDPFCDFDVVFLVTDVAPFDRNREWLDRFGEIMIMQVPEEMQTPPPSKDGGFTYLMQFTDGSRIDLGIYPLSAVEARTGDSLTVVLLDKDGIIPPLPPPSEKDYLPQPPTPKAFADCCNEFWWVGPYVAKGLWREQLPYARTMLDRVLRDELTRMAGWYVGVRTGFSRNPGKFGKYLQRYLEPELWALFEQTYSDAGYEHSWDALLSMGQLFRTLALAVADHFRFEYPQGDDARVTAYLERIRSLPKDAAAVF
jgi:aminoglycoside 6-adenylyltransferase